MPGRPPGMSRSTRHSFLPGPRVDRGDERLAVVVVQDEDAGRRGRPATTRCRSPDTSAADRTASSTAACRRASTRTARRCRSRRRAARRRSPAFPTRTCSCDAGRRTARPCALRAPTSACRWPHRRHRPCSGSRRSRRSARCRAPTTRFMHFVFGQPLRRQLGDVVVAEDAGRRRLERAGADRRGDEDRGPSTRPATTSRGPCTSTLQATLSLCDHVVGSLPSSRMPAPAGPRNCGQATEAQSNTRATESTESTETQNGRARR